MDLLKLSKKLSDLSLRLKYESTYLEMKYYLCKVLNGKENVDYFKKIGHYDRNIGKSCALARLSVKYDIPIAVPCNSCKSLYIRDIPRYLPKYFKNKLPRIIVTNENSIGKRENCILLEEYIPEEQISSILRPMTTSLIGYRNY